MYVQPTESATPSVTFSGWESPELASPSSVPVLACDGSDAEDIGAADVTSPFESVAVCEESSPDAEAVVAPVALATGTSAEPALAVVVEVGPEFASATLPQMNMTTITSFS